MTIKALDALEKGYQRSVNARISVAILYATNLLVVLPFAYALHTTFVATAGSSMEHGVLISGFDFTVISDYLRVNRPALSALYNTAAGAVLAYLVVNIFLSGGIIATVRQDGMSPTAGEFFSGCATYCGRFLRLAFIISAGGLLVAVPVLIAIFSMIGLWEAGAQSEIPETIGLGLRLFFPLLLLVPLLMIYDYARIDTVLTNGGVMRKSARRGIRFVYRRLGRTLKLQVLLFLLFLLLTAFYLAFASLIGTASHLAMVFTVALQQLFVLQRMGLRVFGFAAESALYREVNPDGGGIPGWDTGHTWE